jgi:hypothetical protein
MSESLVKLIVALGESARQNQALPGSVSEQK